MLSDHCLVAVAAFLYFSDVWLMMKACDRTEILAENYQSLGAIAKDIRDLRLIYHHSESMMERPTEHAEMVELLVRSNNRIPDDDWTRFYLMDIWAHARLDHHRVMKDHVDDEWRMLMDSIHEPRLYRKCFLLMRQGPLEETVLFFTPSEIEQILQALKGCHQLYDRFLSYSWSGRM